MELGKWSTSAPDGLFEKKCILSSVASKVFKELPSLSSRPMIYQRNDRVSQLRPADLQPNAPAFHPNQGTQENNTIYQGWRTIGTRAIDGTRHNILGTPPIKTVCILIQNNNIQYEVLRET
ncbi:hypothetical protein TNCV_2610731 [Trichonephila clavipes]|nr:hypothetical protein TNCV_2610731 [Trichonephila clavipes]